MEKRKMKISYNRSGNGGLNPKISLPITFTRELGATEDDREVYIYQIGNKIIISKEDWKMEKALEIILEEIKKEIKGSFICDSDNTDRFVDRTVKEVIRMLSTEEDEEDNIEDYFDELETKAKEFLNNSYKSVYEVKNGNYVGYYFDNCFNFKTVEELENHFLIGE